MKCTSMQLSNKAMCNQPMLLPLREQRKCELFIILTVLQFFVYYVHNAVFLQNPALKVNLESNCKCRGKCAISYAFTSGQLITCDYKHAVDCGGGSRPHEGFVWNYGFANAKCLKPLSVTARLLQDTNTNFVLPL